MLTYLFLCLFITNVYAETVETPYLVADTSTDKTREIMKEEDLYYLRKEGETSNNYYSSKPDDYDTKTDMFIYGKYSKYTTKEINSPDYLKEELTYYHYLELEKINYLKVLTSSNITILDIKLNNNIIKSNNNTYYFNKSKIEDSILEIKLMVLENSNDNYLLIENNDVYLKGKIKIKEKGVVTKKIRLINYLTRLKMNKKVKVTTNYNDLPYYRLLKKEKLYRYRRKLYKYKKNDTLLTSNRVLDGYKVDKVEKINRIYRKELFTFYDDIKLDYLDWDKILVSSTIPLKELKLYKSKECGKMKLKLVYKTFSYLKDIDFTCS